jgi:hypothetical protein
MGTFEYNNNNKLFVFFFKYFYECVTQQALYLSKLLQMPNVCAMVMLRASASRSFSRALAVPKSDCELTSPIGTADS